MSAMKEGQEPIWITQAEFLAKVMSGRWPDITYEMLLGRAIDLSRATYRRLLAKLYQNDPTLETDLRQVMGFAEKQATNKV